MTPDALICDFCSVWQDLRRDEPRKGVIILNLHSTIFIIMLATGLHSPSACAGGWEMERAEIIAG